MLIFVPRKDVVTNRSKDERIRDAIMRLLDEDDGKTTDRRQMSLLANQHGGQNNTMLLARIYSITREEILLDFLK